MQSWASQGLGIKWITLMLDDSNGGTPTTAGALQWKNYWGLDSVAVCADPYYSMVPGSSVGTPMTTLVDPRTMKVIAIQEGYSGNYSQLEQLANSNK
ncbi:MAG: hypothetical protein DRI90_16720 [Deltaproteobacteria bacterium]|nr:MAG: hypothetical protein DRI90_16720 [Deltaproteobacteria bacterium]